MKQDEKLDVFICLSHKASSSLIKKDLKVGNIYQYAKFLEVNYLCSFLNHLRFFVYLVVYVLGSVVSSDQHGGGSDQAWPSQPSLLLILSFKCPSGAAEELSIL